jgi:hypothetical protein
MTQKSQDSLEIRDIFLKIYQEVKPEGWECIGWTVHENGNVSRNGRLSRYDIEERLIAYEINASKKTLVGWFVGLHGKVKRLRPSEKARIESLRKTIQILTMPKHYNCKCTHEPFYALFDEHVREQACEPFNNLLEADNCACECVYKCTLDSDLFNVHTKTICESIHESFDLSLNVLALGMDSRFQIACKVTDRLYYAHVNWDNLLMIKAYFKCPLRALTEYGPLFTQAV